MQEKLAIQELEEHLKIKHDAVEQLETKIMELEKRMKEQEKKQERPIISEPQEEEKTEYFFH
jgi:phage shock protein A